MSSPPNGVPPQATWETGLWSTQEAAWQYCGHDREGRRHGIATYWRGDGTLLCRTHYHHGVEHGLALRFHESTELSQRGHVVDGERHGKHEAFRSTCLTTERAVRGKPEPIWRCETDYEDGVIVRFTRYYDREGKRVDHTGAPLPALPPGVPATAILLNDAWIDGRIDAGRWHGPFRRWNAAGVLVEEGAYRHGRRSGPYTRWTRGGLLVELGVYVGGHIKDPEIVRPAGLPETAVVERSDRGLRWVDGGPPGAMRLVWNEEGRLIEQREYEASALEGTALDWNDEGLLVGRAGYARGKLHGLYERFHADGSIMVSGLYVDGARAGTFTLSRALGVAPDGFPACSLRIARIEELHRDTGTTLRLFDAYGVECTSDGIPLGLWRARNPMRASWRDAVLETEWPGASLAHAILDLAADDEALRRDARAVLHRHCAGADRDPAAAIALGFVTELLGMPDTRDRAALLDLLLACGAEIAGTQTLVTLLDDPDASIRAFTTRLLAQLGAAAAMLAALDREIDVSVRASLHLALGGAAGGLDAADPLERLGAALGLATARGHDAPAATIGVLVAALCEPEPFTRRFHALPWARTTLVAQVCEAFAAIGDGRRGAIVDALLAALAAAGSRTALVLVDALLGFAGDFGRPLDVTPHAVVVAIAGHEAVWERGHALRELLRRRQLPVEQEALRALARTKPRAAKPPPKPKQPRGKRAGKPKRTEA